MAIPIYSPPGDGLSQTTTDFVNQSSVSISHSYSHKPRVLIVNSDGYQIMGDIQFFSNSITITFVEAISGTVYLT
jgi:hypothetical protein